MALLNNIVIDLVKKTATLTVLQDGISCETITFANNQITFAARTDKNITAVDFLDMISQINIFQKALLKTR